MSNLSITPMRAYFDTRLEQGDIFLLSIMCWYTDKEGYCFPSRETLSAIFSPIMGRKTAYDASIISRRIRKLRAAGYVVVERQRTTASVSFKSKLYKVIYEAQLPDQFDRRSQQKTA